MRHPSQFSKTGNAGPHLAPKKLSRITLYEEPLDHCLLAQQGGSCTVIA